MAYNRAEQRYIEREKREAEAGEFQASTQVKVSTKRDAGDGIIKKSEGITHTTICLRPSRGLRMNLRVRRVTGESLSAIFADCRDGLWGLVDGGETGR